MRKKRGYSREIPTELLRDYKLFAIACEGAEREPQYFNVFQHASSRIKVDVIQEDDVNPNNSSPNWVLDKAVKYIETQGLLSEDQLFFVIDKDRWTDEQISTLAEYCDEHENWFLLISNPCFEVWLYFHFNEDIAKSSSTSCKDFKTEITTFAKGGYHPHKFLPYLIDAINNAKSADKNPDYYLPAFKTTKVYKLAEEITKMMGINDFKKFIEDVIPSLIQKEIEKVKIAKARIARK